MPDYLSQILQAAISARTGDIAAYIARETTMTVQAGPFQGMKLPECSSWSARDATPKLLGMYEQALHPAIERAIARNPAEVFNIGSAEGYYAVGLARRLPQALIYACDTDPRAAIAITEAAQLNGVKLQICAEFTPVQISPGVPTLIVADIEGAETSVFDRYNPWLNSTDLIIECHDFMDRSITETLRARFPAHALEIIEEVPRDVARHPLLRGLATLDQCLAVCEFRPESMHWLACWSPER